MLIVHTICCFMPFCTSHPSIFYHQAYRVYNSMRQTMSWTEKRFSDYCVIKIGGQSPVGQAGYPRWLNQNKAALSSSCLLSYVPYAVKINGSEQGGVPRCPGKPRPAPQRGRHKDVLQCAHPHPETHPQEQTQSLATRPNSSQAETRPRSGLALPASTPYKPAQKPSWHPPCTHT